MKQVSSIRRPIVASACVALALALAAWAVPRGSALGEEPRTPTVEPAPKCRTSGDAPTPGPKVMRSRGDGWRYLQHLPAAYDARHPGALLIVLGSTSIDAKDSHGAGRDAIVLEVPEPHRSVGWTPVDRNERFVRDLLLRAEETLCFDRGDVRLAGSGIGADVARDVVAQLDDERVRYLNIEPR